MKQCTKCKIEKKETDFYKNTRNKDGLQYRCKVCSLNEMNTPKFKTQLKEHQKKKSGTWYGVANLICIHMKANAKKKGFKWDDAWWSARIIEEIITDGKCEKTGIPFDITRENRHYKRRPFTPSPDRIDNTKGYEPENVQWVVFMYNLMKNNFDDGDVDKFIDSLKSKSL
jgi:hypothetical protein